MHWGSEAIWVRVQTERPGLLQNELGNYRPVTMTLHLNSGNSLRSCVCCSVSQTVKTSKSGGSAVVEICAVTC